MNITAQGNSGLNIPLLEKTLGVRAQRQTRVKSLAQGPNTGSLVVLGLESLAFCSVTQKLSVDAPWPKTEHFLHWKHFSPYQA